MSPLLREGSIAPRRSRWVPFLIISLAINLWSAFMFPMWLTDEFTAEILVISIIPVLWGFWLLCACRSKGERYVAWLAMLGALYWLLPSVGLPIEYFGR